MTNVWHLSSKEGLPQDVHYVGPGNMEDPSYVVHGTPEGNYHAIATMAPPPSRKHDLEQEGTPREVAFNLTDRLNEPVLPKNPHPNC